MIADCLPVDRQGWSCSSSLPGLWDGIGRTNSATPPSASTPDRPVWSGHASSSSRTDQRRAGVDVRRPVLSSTEEREPADLALLVTRSAAPLLASANALAPAHWSAT